MKRTNLFLDEGEGKWKSHSEFTNRIKLKRYDGRSSYITKIDKKNRYTTNIEYIRNYHKPTSLEIIRCMETRIPYTHDVSNVSRLILKACVNLQILEIDRDVWKSLHQINLYSCTELVGVQIHGDLVGALLTIYGSPNFKYFIGNSRCLAKIDIELNQFKNPPIDLQKRISWNSHCRIETEHLRDTMTALYLAGKRIRDNPIDERPWNPYWLNKDCFFMIIKEMVEQIRSQCPIDEHQMPTAGTRILYFSLNKT